MNKLAVLIPSYNESDNLNEIISEVNEKINELIKNNKISKESSIIIIDDGSTDNSWQEIEKIKNKFDNLKAIQLSKNFGHQVALYAGIKEFYNNFDFSISVDADGQHDISKFNVLIDHYYSGNEIVIAVSDRKDDTLFKKITAKFYYKLLNLISSEKIEPNHADFRLISKKVMEEITKYENKNIFLRGIISTLNFNKKVISYSLKKRKLGRSKYSFSKMIKLALDGVTSQSIYPLRLSTILGLIIIIFCFFSSLLVLFEYFVLRNTIPGWTSIIIPIYFLGGVQIFLIGVIGEYIGKIYGELLKNPVYSIIKKID